MLRFGRRRLVRERDPELVTVWNGAMERNGTAPGISHPLIGSQLAGAINGTFISGLKITIGHGAGSARMQKAPR